MHVPIGRYWTLLVTYLRPQWGTFALLVVLLLSGIGLQLLIPQITRQFLDAATGSNDPLLGLAAGFIGLAFIQQLTTLATTYYGEQVAWRATNALRSDLTQHILRLDLHFHNNRSVGELIERADTDVTQLAEFFSRLVVLVVGNLLLIGGILLLLTAEDWRMGIGFLAFSMAALGTLALVRNIAIPYERARKQAQAEMVGYLEERLVAIEDIRSNGAEAVMIDGLTGKHHVLYESWRALAGRSAVLSGVNGSVMTAAYIVTFLSASALFEAQAITLGTAYLIFNYAVLLTRPFNEISSQIDRFQSIGASVERVEEILHIQPRIQDGGGANVPSGALSVTAEGVSFSYDSTNVLHSINFHLEKGQVLGVLGRTGSGKTTLARLLARLYDVNSGSIRLNDVDVRQFTQADLRQRVAMVTQDVQLFDANLRDNLTFFNREISDDRILHVMEILGLHDWLATRPAGLDSAIESGGRNLSAGEAQLLAFARVFLADPGLVILDEASARLDPATEARLEQAVDRLLDQRTAIIIAHRLRTVQRADVIMILDEGRVVEWGQREQLAADSHSHFYHLLQTGLEEALA